MRNADPPGVPIITFDSSGSSDRQLEDLLKLVYVGGGFTEASLADSLFDGASVRARGQVLVAKDHHGQLLGSVVVVPSGSPACRFAVSDANDPLDAILDDRRAGPLQKIRFRSSSEPRFRTGRANVSSIGPFDLIGLTILGGVDLFRGPTRVNG